MPITMANHGQDSGKVLVLTQGKSSGQVTDSYPPHPCASGFLDDNKWKEATAGLKPDLLARSVTIFASFGVFHYKEGDAQTNTENIS